MKLKNTDNYFNSTNIDYPFQFISIYFNLFLLISKTLHIKNYEY